MSRQQQQTSANLDKTQRTAELSAIVYNELIKRGCLDSSHLPIARGLGKLALTLRFAKETNTLFNDSNRSPIEQASDIGIDLLLSKLPTGALITVNAIELFGNYVAPVIVEEVEAAIVKIAQTEQEILNRLPEHQRITWESEFTLSQEMQEAITWVKGTKWLAEKSDQAKSWVGSQIQSSIERSGADKITQTMETVSLAARKREEQIGMVYTAGDSLSEEYQEAAGIFALINRLSKKVKDSGKNEIVDEAIDQNYSLFIPESEEIQTTSPKQEKTTTMARTTHVTGQDHRLLTQNVKKQPTTLDPKLGVSISATASGFALVGKVSLNLTAVSLGMGLAVAAAMGVTVSILNSIKKKHFKKIKKQHQKNMDDANQMNAAYTHFVENYKNSFNIEDIADFTSTQTALSAKISGLIDMADQKRRSLKSRKDDIKKQYRKEYKELSYRKTFHEIRAYYDSVIDTLQKIKQEINKNLELINHHQSTLKLT